MVQVWPRFGRVEPLRESSWADGSRMVLIRELLIQRWHTEVWIVEGFWIWLWVF